jgi:hypothetical protein
VLTIVNASTATSENPKASRELAKVLSDCRGFAVPRMTEAFAGILDKIGNTLMDRASKSDVREDQQLYLDTRQMLKSERAKLLAEFGERMATQVDEAIAGRAKSKQDFSTVDASALTLVDTTAMDRAVLTGNVKRIIENTCHDELSGLNRAIGYLMGRPDLETDDNPLAPTTIVEAFWQALAALRVDERMKFQVMRELNQAPLSDINAIYADLNQHLARLKVIPASSRPVIRNTGGSEARRDKVAAALQSPPPPQVPEVDVMALFQRMFAHAPPMPHAGQGMPPGLQPFLPHMPPGAGYAPASAAGAPGGLDFPAIQSPSAARAFAPLPPTASGYVPGMPIIQSEDLHEGLVRLQAGQTNFDVGGASVQFSGIPSGLHNVLRDLQESPLGAKANQLESMTIEMVAMLFDFVFETRDLPDGIKALLARLQIPVLKAAMLDGAFFAKKTHPARMLVNRLAEAGLGWSPVMGNEDPLYREIEKIVHRVLDEFSDDLSLFDTLREELDAFLAAEEKAAESNIASSAEEINQRDRVEIAGAVARSEVEQRIEAHKVPAFLAAFLRQHWQRALAHVYATEAEDSEAWNSAVTTLEDLVWSVQPKRSQEDRKHLVALLPSLLKRINGGMQVPGWPPDDREKFLANLVEAHAAAVKPSLAHVESPTAAVAEHAKVQAEIAKAQGDDAAARQAAALAEAMAPAPPPEEVPEPVVQDDEYLEIARNLERGMWVEFANEDGQLAFAKLAWVSPLRGTYLFTNRQGQKALSITAEELAEHFRTDRARLVEAEPLIDRAMSSMMVQMEEKIPEHA